MTLARAARLANALCKRAFLILAYLFAPECSRSL